MAQGSGQESGNYLLELVGVYAQAVKCSWLGELAMCSFRKVLGMAPIILVSLAFFERNLMLLHTSACSGLASIEDRSNCHHL